MYIKTNKQTKIIITYDSTDKKDFMHWKHLAFVDFQKSYVLFL